MKEHTKRMGIRAVWCGFLLAAVASLFPFAAASEALPENVVRLHVLANSDSEEDQAVKLLVRDAVLEEAAAWYAGASDRQEAAAAICLHLGSIRAAAERTLTEHGCPYGAAVQVTDRYFSTREYEDFTLPAGTYRTLQVTLGEGEGHNWWCVVFPALCLPAAEKGSGSDALALLPESQREVVSAPRQHRVKFKAVELIEAAKQFLQNP